MYRHAAIALVIALSLVACGVTDPSNNTKSTFTGTLNPGAGNSNSFPFNVANSGELTVTVTTLTPVVPNGTYFEIGMGQTLGSTCSAIQVNQTAVVGFDAISGYPITPGAYCVFIQDEGLFTVPETFTIVVSHP